MNIRKNIKSLTAITLLWVLCGCMPLLTHAQTYDTISGPDGRYYKYHYTSWFDSCYSYTGGITTGRPG